MGGDPFDHLVAVLASVMRTPLVSSDARIAALPGMRVACEQSAVARNINPGQ
jgi:hypothetical protein